MTESYHGFIDTARDALLIFEACNLGYLPRVQRRFSERERQTIRSGAVYIWDEEETGMRRWTDGRTWSPSRVHGCFLIYYELEGRRHQFVNGSNNRTSRYSPRSGQVEASPLHTSYDSCPPNIMQKEQGLIKKALSLCTNDKRKLHLVCYYSREDVESGCLTSPTNDPRFANIQVCEDRYPEIGHGSSRGDRYSRSRFNNQQRAISVGSASARDGPPAYVRSSMAAERRSPRSYRSEVYRYPSYGPYAGPVRHVQVPVQQQAAVPQPAGPTVVPASPHVVVYGPPAPISTPRDDKIAHSGPLRSPATYQPSSSTPYIQHPHSYPASPWPATPQPSSNHHVYSKHASTAAPAPSSVPSTPATPSYPAHPIWQHSEPPMMYAGTRSSGSIHPPPPGAQWDGNTKGLMIHLAEPNRSPVTGNSASSVPPTPSIHYSEYNAQQQPRVQPQTPHSAAPPLPNGISHHVNTTSAGSGRPPIRLPPISKFDSVSPTGLSSNMLSMPCSPMANMKLEADDAHVVADPRRVVSSKSARWSPYTAESRGWKRLPPSPTPSL
ncbi:Gluconate transport-inducing protein, partial [Linderina macrospora]